MTSRKVTLGGRTFDVPLFVLRHTIQIYPLCQKLGGVVARSVLNEGVLTASAEEMIDMADAVFLGCRAAEPALTRDEFDNLPVAPHELFEAFLIMRIQTGAWRQASSEGSDDAGEAPGGTAAPQTDVTSTSIESSAS